MLPFLGTLSKLTSHSLTGSRVQGVFSVNCHTQLHWNIRVNASSQEVPELWVLEPAVLYKFRKCCSGRESRPSQHGGRAREPGEFPTTGHTEWTRRKPARLAVTHSWAGPPAESPRTSMGALSCTGETGRAEGLRLRRLCPLGEEFAS